MKILGQDVTVVYNQLLALVGNIQQWLLRSSLKRHLKRLTSAPNSAYVSISGPGGFDRLEVLELPDDQATVGYNVSIFQKGSCLVNISDKSRLPQDLVIVRIHYYSINYADIAIRWGLYESALRFVGWPIVPGFDVSGVVEWAGAETGFNVGDEVFGFSMFGTYSSRVILPGKQIRKLPKRASLAQGAAIPAVAATGLHALALSGGWPRKPFTSNKAVLIHSAAGGVGSMLIQMCKKVGCHPIVAVVGTASKAEYCKKLGADYVIVKKRGNLSPISSNIDDVLCPF
jgi:NADPH:quinone reductase-like Zn-dependent oxidoreductase